MTANLLLSFKAFVSCSLGPQMVAGALVGMGLMQLIVSSTLSMLLRHTRRYAVLGEWKIIAIAYKFYAKKNHFPMNLCQYFSRCILFPRLSSARPVPLEAVQG